MTTTRINQAIKHLGIEIVRGQGYQYFCDLETGVPVGESVLVCYLNQCTLQQWVKEAEDAKKLELSFKTSNINLVMTKVYIVYKEEEYRTQSL